MAISQNFPNTRPSLNLNFARSKKLDPRITFTRSSTATYVDEDGLIKSVATNTPRFDHDPVTGECLGLLIEEQRTNLVSYSAYNAATWSKIETTGTGTLTTGIDAPDGSTNAVRITFNNNGNILLRVNIPAFTPNGTDTYTTSFYVRRISGTGGVSTDLNDGNPSTDYSSRLITNQWVRVTVSGIPTATSKSFIDLISDTNTNYVLDFWGLQLEQGSFATSLITTTGSTATRSADNAIISGTNFSNFYNSTEGTLFAAARINALGGNNYPGIVYVDDGTVNNTIGIYVNDAGGDWIGAEAYISNVVQSAINTNPTPTITPGQLTKVIYAYKASNFGATFSITNTVGTTASGSVPTVSRMIIGLLRGGNAPLNGTIAQLSYYPVRLPNSQLQTLTR